MEELVQRLQNSEQRRAKTIADLALAEIEIQRLRQFEALGSSPSRRRTAADAQATTAPRDAEEAAARLKEALEVSEGARARMARELTMLHEEKRLQDDACPAAPPGMIRVAPAATAEDEDFGFDEEESARVQAEEVMSQLLHARRELQLAREEAMEAALQLTEARTERDTGVAREKELRLMLDRYQLRFEEQRSELCRLNAASSAGTHDDEQSRWASHRLAALEAEVRDLKAENSALRAELHQPQGQQRANERPIGGRSTGSGSTTDSPQGPPATVAGQQLLEAAFLQSQQRGAQLEAVVEQLRLGLKEKNRTLVQYRQLLRAQNLVATQQESCSSFY